jgi:hypothetical protein
MSDKVDQLNTIIEYKTLHFNEKIFYFKDKKCIIVPKHIEFWDNFHIIPYAEYAERKFIYNLKQINYN